MASDSILTVKRKKRTRRPWSNLHEDILRQVVERLCLEDRIHLRAVCKNWLLTPIHDIPLVDTLPWLMSYYFSPHRTVCSLSIPSRKLPYITEEERRWADERGWIPAGSLLFRAEACASRCGWVLFLEKNRQVVNSTLYHVYQYYVYNPLTKDIISLPGLQRPRDYHHFERFATFSSAPTSPDCVFIAPSIGHRGQYFISTYSIGDKAWKTHTFTCPPPYFFPIDGMAYMDGSFYCYSVGRGMSSFHIATQEWRLPSNACFLRNEDILNGERWYFVAYDGHLHLVHLRAPRCNIFRYDWLDGAWKKMKSLEGWAIFLGKSSFGVAAGEQTKMIANRVYYFPSHTSAPRFLVYGSPGMEVKSESSQSKIYDDSWPEKSKRLGESKRWTWMEPPFC